MRAESEYKKAVKIYKKIMFSSGLRTAYNYLSKIYQQQGYTHKTNIYINKANKL